MKLFPWAKYTSTKGSIKLHTALDLQLALPVVMNMTNAKVHDSKATRDPRIMQTSCWPST